MKIALVGYGSMGQAVRLQAEARKHEIVEIFDENRPLASERQLSKSAVLVDFSIAEAVLPLLHLAASAGTPVVEGTTGWYDRLSEARSIENLTMVFSPNFSLGVHQFDKLVRLAAELLGPLGGYDVYLHEWHHAGKLDSPSGTAGALARTLLEALPKKRNLLTETCHRRIESTELHVTSTRVGRMPGTHEVGFDSAADTITLRHQAHGREGFAHGAVLAAEWILDRKGVFDMDDLVRGIAEKRGLEG